VNKEGKRLKLTPEERRANRLATYRRCYKKNREKRLAYWRKRYQEMKDQFKLQRIKRAGGLAQ
jgi:hypothetical protein